MRYASLGSISHGTLRIEDLLKTFSAELARLVYPQPRGFARGSFYSRKSLNESANRTAKILRKGSDAAKHEQLNVLIVALDFFAPPYCRFGAHPGDGSDFGFWFDDKDFDRNFEGLRVSGLEEIPRSYTGEVAIVNDHGNLTIGFAKRGKFAEIISIV